MKRIILFTLCLISSIIIFSGTSFAVGLGVYGLVGSGSGTMDVDYYDSYWGSLSESRDVDFTHSGFGFVLDTAVSTDTVFNYRLNLGYEKADLDFTEYTNGKAGLNGFVLDNDFGFGIVRTENIRLWAGPELRIGYFEGTADSNSNWKIKLATVGLGPVLGINFNMGEVVTLSLKGGYLYDYYGGTGKDSTGYYYDEDYSGSVTHGFINLALIFRLGEYY